MKESQVQELLIRRARARNWEAWKTKSEGTKGFPDVVIAGPRVVFVEVKKWNKPNLDPHQKIAEKALKKSGAIFKILIGGMTLEGTHANVEHILDQIGAL